MSGVLRHIWRYPLKAHGREELESVTLTKGHTMPFDRHWAVAHDRAKFDPAKPAWAACANFNIGSRDPKLTAINATYEDTTGALTLTHPERSEITFNPDKQADCWRFLDWVEPLIDADRPRPASVVKAPDRGMTDTDFPSISLHSMASHIALEDLAGQSLSPKRWRGNLWFDGLSPWEERDWIGKSVQIGEVILAVREPIGRCKMTTTNPETGVRDFDTLAVLDKAFGHLDFGVYSEVINGGTLRIGDTLDVLT